MNYPKCTSAAELRGLPDGYIVHLLGWGIQRTAYPLYFLLDGEHAPVKVHDLPLTITSLFSQANDSTMFGFDLHVRISSSGYSPYPSWKPASFSVHYYDPQKGQCTCGAQHTSFPNNHSTWCDIHIWK